MKRLWVLIAADFLLFSAVGFYVDLIYRGVLPYVVALTIALCAGLNAALWIIVLSRLSMPFLVGLLVLQFFTTRINTHLANWMISSLGLKLVPSESGIHFAATAMMSVIILSYVFFVVYIRREGNESFRLRNELELAHGIQKTLVPPLELRTSRFEIYGVSHPSEKVGGDLVDAIFLPNGDAIAYVADIAGHGLPAGILMGMLKTATRTALLDAEGSEPHRTLPVLLDRLNRVLPEVKEPHMYATFTGFRLGADGSVFYALAASPPILQWHASERTLSHTEESQFPLGLLPVSSFDGQRLEVASGDLLVVATDGILEVCNKPPEEFGVERLKQVIAANAENPLPELAATILAAARGFGPQLDDQTILIVRCL
ncbi:PP2C family protein-serine/threonine phosphatase [Tunturibacter psychrotolerans]|uniref:PP2C family protein-serine/threonine phosphatase n=1 Tax=Tunturiibacter psychrotolerans TaxID=3069686 RepID=A0AAU7ZPZ6_9BACT